MKRRTNRAATVRERVSRRKSYRFLTRAALHEAWNHKPSRDRKGACFAPKVLPLPDGRGSE